MQKKLNPTLAATAFRHPKGLSYLFFAELWERFSFYGMRALLVLYMTKKLLLSDDMSIGTYAVYMSMVYISPLIGGMIADRILGFKRAILLGGIFIALGHFLITFETPFYFYSSLGIIIVGNGFFKPNISSFLGELYEKDNSKRDAGFTIFYMGINIGGAVSPLICAWVAEYYGWKYSFLLAGMGMISGLIFFYSGMQKSVFGNKGEVPNLAAFNQKWMGLNQFHRVIIGAILAMPCFALLIFAYQYEHYFVWLVSLFLGSILFYMHKNMTHAERKKLGVIIYFTLLAVLFFAIFEQGGSSLTLFADRNVNLLGITAAQTNSINSTFVILLALPFSLLWNILTRHHKNPNSALKFGIGLCLLGVGFLVFAVSSHAMDQWAKVPMFYLLAGYFILTLGELFLSPIGLSKMTELSPAKYLALVMGIWFCASFYGHYFAGKIAMLTTSKLGSNSDIFIGTIGKITDTITGMHHVDVMHTQASFKQLYAYVSIYALFGLISLACGIISLLLAPRIKQLMQEVH